MQNYMVRNNMMAILAHCWITFFWLAIGSLFFNLPSFNQSIGLIVAAIITVLSGWMYFVAGKRMMVPSGNGSRDMMSLFFLPILLFMIWIYSLIQLESGGLWGMSILEFNYPMAAILVVWDGVDPTIAKYLTSVTLFLPTVLMWFGIRDRTVSMARGKDVKPIIGMERYDPKYKDRPVKKRTWR